jgi:hypothetical protein
MVGGAVCRPLALMLLCEFILNSNRSPPAEDFLYHTLLELYLSDALAGDEGAADGTPPVLPSCSQRWHGPSLQPSYCSA